MRQTSTQRSASSISAALCISLLAACGRSPEAANPQAAEVAGYAVVSQVFAELAAVPEVRAFVHTKVSANMADRGDEYVGVKALLDDPAGPALRARFEALLSDPAFLSRAGAGDGGVLLARQVVDEDRVELYWPFSEDWDGASAPTLTFDPLDESGLSTGFRAPGGSIDPAAQVQVDWAYAERNPVWVVQALDELPVAEAPKLEPLAAPPGQVSISLRRVGIPTATYSRIYGTANRRFWVGIGGLQVTTAGNTVSYNINDGAFKTFVITAADIQRGYKNKLVGGCTSPCPLSLMSTVWNDEDNKTIWLVRKGSLVTRTYSIKSTITVPYAMAPSWGMNLELAFSDKAVTVKDVKINWTTTPIGTVVGEVSKTFTVVDNDVVLGADYVNGWAMRNIYNVSPTTYQGLRLYYDVTSY